MQFRYGPIELGHLHGSRFADLPFPKALRWFFFPPHVAAWQAVASIALLLTLGTAALVAAWAYLRWQKAQR